MEEVAHLLVPAARHPRAKYRDRIFVGPNSQPRRGVSVVQRYLRVLETSTDPAQEVVPFAHASPPGRGPPLGPAGCEPRRGGAPFSIEPLERADHKTRHAYLSQPPA